MLRYHNELFDSDWIEALTTREIAHCELLRKHPHPTICRYHGVDHKKDLAITGIYFDRYDTTLQDLVEAGKQFDPQKCIQDIREGLTHSLSGLCAFRHQAGEHFCQCRSTSLRRWRFRFDAKAGRTCGGQGRHTWLAPRRSGGKC